MRIVQIIDSLDAGGAEKMAVNYANELSNKIAFSGLVVSRSQGQLINQLDKKVNYLYLNKKRTIDVLAIYKLVKFVKKNKIEIVHAHSTSFFLGFLIKIFVPSLKLIWHDHYGDSDFLHKRPATILLFIIRFYDGAIVVNNKLELWAKNKLNAKNIIYLPNFPSEEFATNSKTVLKGTSGKRIVNLANLRPQKNHVLLLKVAQKLLKQSPDWTFHLVGKDFNDNYSQEIKSLIISSNLQENVFVYGSRQDIEHILKQSDIAILTSSSEGLPLALLEYGLNKKAVVATNVGAIAEIIQNNVNGFLINPNDETRFLESLIKLIDDEQLREKFSNKLYDVVCNNFSKEVIINKYLEYVLTI